MLILKIAIRKLFKKGEHTFSKIITLSLGLAFGILLMGEVFYYDSYYNYCNDADRLYVIGANFQRSKESKAIDSYSISGGVAPIMKKEIPAIEVATRMTNIGRLTFSDENKQYYKAKVSLVDEYWNEIFSRPMLSGNAKQALSTPMTCIISDKMAKTLCGDVVGKEIEFTSHKNKKFTIRGIFKSMPENSIYTHDILVSMSSIKVFMWDGSMNLIGNDRYFGAVKLKKGIKPENLKKSFRNVLEKYSDIKKYEESGEVFHFEHFLYPLTKIYSHRVGKITYILFILGFSILFISLMNYLLLNLVSIVNKVKSSAIHKCYGANRKDIIKGVFLETFILFAISLIITIGIITILSPAIESLTSHSVLATFNSKVISSLIILIGVLISIIAYIPANYYARIPVATIFRDFKMKTNKWKNILLGIQIISTSLIFGSLILCSMQYHKMTNTDHGYKSNNIHYFYSEGIKPNKFNYIVDKIQNLPFVEYIGMGSMLPNESPSGNNVIIDGKEAFNIGDCFWIDHNYFKIFEMNIIKGRDFSKEKSIRNEMIISESFVKKLRNYNAYKNYILDNTLKITGYHTNETNKVKGILSDFICGTISHADTRPKVFYYRKTQDFKQLAEEAWNFNIIIKLKAHHPNNALETIRNIANEAFTKNGVSIRSYENRINNLYHAEKGFIYSIMAGSGIVFIITIIGLIGYATSESNRRRKELAIRKINGASLKEVLKLFSINLLKLCIPTIALGQVLAWMMAKIWISNFSIKIELSWWIFFACGTLIMLLILIIAILNYYKAANENPSKILYQE